MQEREGFVYCEVISSIKRKSPPERAVLTGSGGGVLLWI